MLRMIVVVGALLLGAGAVMAQQEIAVQQDNLMRGQAKSLYTVMLKMVKGEIPYDQAAVDNAIKELEESVPKIATVFATNPKQQVAATIATRLIASSSSDDLIFVPAIPLLHLRRQRQ